MEAEHIYLDLDGVLADFEEGVKTLTEAGYTSETISGGEAEELMWDGIRNTPHFYLRLPLEPGAKEMFNLLWEKYGSKCEILTGIPKESRNITGAKEDKIQWAAENLAPDIKVNTVLKTEKKNFVKSKASVLIDDFYQTVEIWNEAGGTAIHHINAEETLLKLKELGIL